MRSRSTYRPWQVIVIELLLSDPPQFGPHVIMIGAVFKEKKVIYFELK